MNFTNILNKKIHEINKIQAIICLKFTIQSKIDDKIKFKTMITSKINILY